MFEKIRRPGRSLKDGKIKKWFSYLLFGLICIIFVFLAPMGSQLLGEKVFGYVGSEPIRARELRLVEANIRQQYKSRLEQADEKTYSLIQQKIRHRALQYLVELSLIAQGSKKSNFFLSDEELKSEIRSIQMFQNKGRFLYSRYLKFLKQEKINPSRFEERIRKMITAKNWSILFKKAVISNTLEKKKKSARHSYKINFNYAVLNAGDIEDQKLEPFLKSKDLKKVHHFLKKHKIEWEKTGEFSLFSSLGQVITHNQIVMDEIIHHLPVKGLIPRMIRHGDDIYIVHILSFQQKSQASMAERQLEGLLEQNFNKSVRVLDSWTKAQRKKIKVRLSNQI